METQIRDAAGNASLAAFLGLVALAEVSFAVLVALTLGEPPAPVTTVGFGVAIAGGLTIQERSRRSAEIGAVGPHG